MVFKFKRFSHLSNQFFGLSSLIKFKTLIINVFIKNRYVIEKDYSMP